VLCLAAMTTSLTPMLLAALASAGAPSAPDRPAGDPLLDRLIEESLARRPELRQADEVVRAERERVPQAGALPDPVLTLARWGRASGRSW